jgi:hypothetical protein
MDAIVLDGPSLGTIHVPIGYVVVTSGAIPCPITLFNKIAEWSKFVAIRELPRPRKVGCRALIESIRFPSRA